MGVKVAVTAYTLVNWLATTTRRDDQACMNVQALDTSEEAKVLLKIRLLSALRPRRDFPVRLCFTPSDSDTIWLFTKSTSSSELRGEIWWKLVTTSSRIDNPHNNCIAIKGTTYTVP